MTYRYVTPGLAVILTIWLAGCAAPAPKPYNFSKGETVRKAVSGKTVIGQLSDGVSYCEYHDPNGTLIGRDDEIYAGNWDIYGNDICYRYPGQDTDCQRALVRGNRITFLDKHSGAMVSQGNLVSGNVCN